MAEPEYGEAFTFSVPSWRMVGLVATTALAFFLLFGLLADFDRVANVRGTIVPTSGLSRLSAPQSGVVTVLVAAQGAVVRKGQPLLRIASASFLPSGAAGPAQTLRAFRQQQQVAAEQLQADQQRLQAERGQLAQQAAQLIAATASLQAQIGLQGERVASNEKKLEGLRQLHEKGYASLFSYQTQQDAVLAARQQLAQLEQNKAASAHELEQVKSRMTELDATSRSIALQSAASRLALERGATGAQTAAEVTVAAPITGQLTLLRVVPGQSVTAGEELAALMKPGDPMEALLFVPSDAAGFLHPGQEVTIRFDAFPYQRYGLGRGIVTDIASSAAIEPGSAQPAFRVRVKLTALPPGSQESSPKPDSTLSASIVVERRSLLDWLFAPLREKWSESVQRRRV